WASPLAALRPTARRRAGAGAAPPWHRGPRQTTRGNRGGSEAWETRGSRTEAVTSEDPSPAARRLAATSPRGSGARWGLAGHIESERRPPTMRRAPLPRGEVAALRRG